MSKVESFVSYLEKLVEQEDRATLAKLRHSLAFEPGEYVHAFPFVERFTVDVGIERRKLYFLLAGLFATHPEISHDPKENLGQTVKRLYLAQDESPSIEKRFLAVLEADDDQLPQHLRHLVNLLKAKNLAVNWQLLLKDLINRQYNADATKRRWAQSFYRPIYSEESEQKQKTQQEALSQ